jgi:hypothetical protein
MRAHVLPVRPPAAAAAAAAAAHSRSRRSPPRRRRRRRSDCVLARIQGRGIIRSECPTCHQPGWKKDLASNSLANGVVARLQSLEAQARALGAARAAAAPAAPAAPAAAAAAEPAASSRGGGAAEPSPPAAAADDDGSAESPPAPPAMAAPAPAAAAPPAAASPAAPSPSGSSLDFGEDAAGIAAWAAALAARRSPPAAAEVALLRRQAALLEAALQLCDELPCAPEPGEEGEGGEEGAAGGAGASPCSETEGPAAPSQQRRLSPPAEAPKAAPLAAEAAAAPPTEEAGPAFAAAPPPAKRRCSGSAAAPPLPPAAAAPPSVDEAEGDAGAGADDDPFAFPPSPPKAPPAAAMPPPPPPPPCRNPYESQYAFHPSQYAAPSAPPPRPPPAPRPLGTQEAAGLLSGLRAAAAAPSRPPPPAPRLALAPAPRAAGRASQPPSQGIAALLLRGSQAARGPVPGGPVVAVLAAASPERTALVLSLAARLPGGLRLDAEVGPETTHVLVETDDAGRARRRSRQLLLGLARGAWVLSFAWAEASAAAGGRAREAAYEASGVAGDAAATGAPGRWRRRVAAAAAPLLAGRRVFAANFSRDHDRTRGLVRDLAAALGAELVTCARGAGVVAVTDSAAVAAGLRARGVAEVAHPNWVLDAVARCEALPVAPYRMPGYGGRAPRAPA